MDNTRRAPDMVYRKLDLTRVDDIELLALLGGRDARTRTSVGIAYYNLGMYREALPYLREAAGGGSLLALEYLAEMNYYGQGMPEDRAEAFRIDTEAAERGSLYAMYSLGVMYLRGVAMEQDLDKGLELIRRAASAKYPQAVSLLGSLYMAGVAVDRDLEEAERLLVEAEALGSRRESANLALLRSMGEDDNVVLDFLPKGVDPQRE